MVDLLNVNRRSTEIPFPLFIHLFLYFFHKERTSKARGGGGGCGRTRRTPPGYGPVFHIFYCNFGRAEENRSLYRGLRYIEVR